MNSNHQLQPEEKREEIQTVTELSTSEAPLNEEELSRHVHLLS
jgi:hypothetical protein